MLTKEYRILLPLSVDEYRVAQLYMIQRKSQEETKGVDSGVEIIVNEPYHHTDGSSGQYTFKIYHIEGHLPGMSSVGARRFILSLIVFAWHALALMGPLLRREEASNFTFQIWLWSRAFFKIKACTFFSAWFRAILPDSAMKIVEESWNAYPYTKTRFSCPFIDKFYLEVETKYFNDAGCQENVFNLSETELNLRTVDVMDIVNDSIPAADYRKAEDPKLYKSKVTGRGPLTDNWVEECIATGRPIMCAYKLCKVQFNYWGMQSKVEKFVHDFALRRTMLRAHRQAWAWQDEWFNLSIEDVRRLEIQAQRILQERMNGKNANNVTCREPLAGVTLDQTAVARSPIERLNFSKGTEPALLLDEEDEEEEEDNAVYFDALEFSSLDESGNRLEKLADREQRENVGQEVGKLTKLLLVFHGGHILDACSDQMTTHCKEQDVRAFRWLTLHVDAHFLAKRQHAIAVRLVPCANVFCDSLKLLQNVSPYYSSQSQDGAKKFWAFAPSLVPVMSTKSSKYSEELSRAVDAANRVYQEFLDSEKGSSFAGEVSICGDAVGGLLAFDALCTPPASFMRSSKHGFIFTSATDEENPEQTPDTVNQGGVSFSLDSKFESASTVDSCSILERQSTLTTPTENARALLKFPVENLFLFGTSLGLVLSSRQLSSGCQTLPACNCHNVYNLYYASDSSSARIEPLLLQEFSTIPSVKILPYSQFPLGDGQSLHLLDWMTMDTSSEVTSMPSSPWTTMSSSPTWNRTLLRSSFACLSVDGTSLSSKGSSCRSSSAADSLAKWWGSKRIDYELFAPDDLLRLPFLSLSSFFYASFWESCDVAAFVLRQLLSGGTTRSSTMETNTARSDGTTDKWLRKLTGLKLKNIAANHRANDVIASENHRQARFMYGPFDVIALSGECVDIYMMSQGPVGDWTYCGSELTDNHGRLRFELSDPLPVGLYPVRMIVKGDRTFSDLCLAVLPPETECVVFSIDGSFSASMSLTGRNPKVRPAAVDVARFWQDLGYLILYVSARPDVQQRVVTCWLAEHNFPFGLLFFNEGFSADLLKQKTNTLKSLTADCKIKIEVAYGSAKDVRGYRELGLDSDHIFAIGKISKKLQPDCTPLLDGYSRHLSSLRNNDLPLVTRPAVGKGQVVVQRSRLSFGDYLSSFRKNFSVHRTRSFTPQCTRRPFLGTSELKVSSAVKRLSNV
ncbi:protein retinal degeneration B [Trichuris trichiura]|uniref:Protein retinal degeneration B n=1 Tax=Trichuris trichiura TaxID=36087 RepID=A0A077Z1I3_TRITR|nr:protein retinal degeneration B [Trichuris trichiura]